MRFQGGERGSPCSFEVPITSAFASCRVVVFADLFIWSLLSSVTRGVWPNKGTIVCAKQEHASITFWWYVSVAVLDISLFSYLFPFIWCPSDLMTFTWQWNILWYLARLKANQPGVRYVSNVRKLSYHPFVVLPVFAAYVPSWCLPVTLIGRIVSNETKENLIITLHSIWVPCLLFTHKIADLDSSRAFISIRFRHLCFNRSRNGVSELFVQNLLFKTLKTIANISLKKFSLF